MCEETPSESFSMGIPWASQGIFLTQANYPENTIARSPPQNTFEQWYNNLFFNFYHGSQESASMCKMMKKLGEYTFEQRRKSETIRLQKKKNCHMMQYLERVPLTRNVILTIEIPNSEHFDMIARMGAWCDKDSIPQIMQDTGVLIQFPGHIFRRDNGEDSINRVTLSGPLSKVEEARIRIRNFTPITISFPLRTLKHNILLKDVKRIVDKAIAEKFINFPELEIMIQPIQLPVDAVSSCVVRGTILQEEDICNACASLHQLLIDAANEEDHRSAKIYWTIMDIPIVQQQAVKGMPDNFLIDMINMETNAVIYFPSSTDYHHGTTAFYLNGSVRSIMQARKYIQGLLPVQLNFDVENGDLVYPVDASNREIFLRDKELDLTVKVERSLLEGEKITTKDTLRNMVTIESVEYNLTNVYAVRRRLFRDDVLRNEPLVVATDFNFLKPDLKALIAKSNQIIAESMSKMQLNTGNSLPLIVSKLQTGCSAISSPTAVLRSSFMNGVTEQILQPQNLREIMRLNKNEYQLVVDEICKKSSTLSAKELKAMTKTTAISSAITKKGSQQVSDLANETVTKFLNLFKKAQSIVPINDAQGSYSEATVSQKVATNRSFKAAEWSNVDATTGNSMKPQNIFRELPIYAQPFVISKSQNSETPIPTLQNSSPQWPQSLDRVKTLELNGCFGRMSRNIEKRTTEATTAEFKENAGNFTSNSLKDPWLIKRNSALKSPLINERYVRQCQKKVATNTFSPNTPFQMVQVQDVKNPSFDLHASQFSRTQNDKTPYSASRGNFPKNSPQNRFWHKNNENIKNQYDQQAERLPTRKRDGTIVWVNSKQSVILPESHPRTLEIVARKYQGLLNQNTPRPNGVSHPSRTNRESMAQCMTFTRTKSYWNTLPYNEERRLGNRPFGSLHHKKRLMNGTAQEGNIKSDQRVGKLLSSEQRGYQGRITDNNYDKSTCKEPEGLRKNIIESSSSSRSKDKMDAEKRVEVMELIEAVRRSRARQTSYSNMKNVESISYT